MKRAKLSTSAPFRKALHALGQTLDRPRVETLARLAELGISEAQLMAVIPDGFPYYSLMRVRARTPVAKLLRAYREALPLAEALDAIDETPEEAGAVRAAIDRLEARQAALDAEADRLQVGPGKKWSDPFADLEGGRSIPELQERRSLYASPKKWPLHGDVTVAVYDLIAPLIPAQRKRHRLPADASKLRFKAEAIRLTADVMTHVVRGWGESTMTPRDVTSRLQSRKTR